MYRVLRDIVKFTCRHDGVVTSPALQNALTFYAYVHEVIRAKVVDTINFVCFLASVLC